MLRSVTRLLISFCFQVLLQVLRVPAPSEQRQQSCREVSDTRLLPPGAGCLSRSTRCARRALIPAVIWLSGAAVAVGSFPSVFAARARAVISLQECATASLLPAEGEGSTKMLFGGIKSPAAHLSFAVVSPRGGLPLAARARHQENSLSLSLFL